MGSKKELFNIFELYFDSDCLAGLTDVAAHQVGDQTNQTFFGANFTTTTVGANFTTTVGLSMNQTLVSETPEAILEAKAFLDTMMAPLRFDQTVFAALAFVIFVWLVMQGKVPKPKKGGGGVLLCFWIVCNCLQMVSYVLAIVMVIISYASMTTQYGSCLRTWGSVPLLHIGTGLTLPMQPAIAHKFLGFNTCTVAMFKALKYLGHTKGTKEESYPCANGIGSFFEIFNKFCVYAGYVGYSVAVAVWTFSASFLFSIVFLPFSQFAYVLVVELMLVAHAFGQVRKWITKTFLKCCKQDDGDDSAWIMNSLKGISSAMNQWSSSPANSVLDFITLLVPLPFVEPSVFYEKNTSIGQLTHFAISFILFSQFSIIGLMLAFLTYSGNSGSEIITGLYLNFYADCFQGMQLPDFADLASLDMATLSDMFKSLQHVSPVAPLEGSKVMASLSMLVAIVKAVTVSLSMFISGAFCCKGGRFKIDGMRLAEVEPEKDDQTKSWFKKMLRQSRNETTQTNESHATA